MERVSGLDARLLYVEGLTQPLHVCSILELDTSTVLGGYTYEHLRDELALRIAAIPEFRAKLADSQFNLDYPVWVEDDEFDLDRHLLRIGLPPPEPAEGPGKAGPLQIAASGDGAGVGARQMRPARPQPAVGDVLRT